tara:strand:+ start:87 stop:281 length:195 start_codon:yes stop_codon:yes gene_type:complete
VADKTDEPGTFKGRSPITRPGIFAQTAAAGNENPDKASGIASTPELIVPTSLSNTHATIYINLF